MPTTLTFDGLRLECASRAGDFTWLRVHPPGLAIDVGRGSTRLAGVGRVFLTHGHLDHSLGLPFQLSMRAGREAPPLEIFCPLSIADRVRDFIEAASALDDRRYDYRLRGLSPGERVAVGDGLWMEPFATDHVVDGLGYHLVRRKHRLRADLMGASGDEIVALRRRGQQVDEVFEEYWLSCTGDTSPTVLESVPQLFESLVLVIECTFLGTGHAKRARLFKHMHLDDLVAARDRFANRALVLYHLSRRHRVTELRAAVDERLQPLGPEVHVVG